MRRILAGATLLLAAVGALEGQQVADTAFRPPIEKPAYPPGKGPVVLIDEGHDNFHTATGRYLPFAELLRRDGCVVKAAVGRLTADGLRAAKVLVIANARKPAARPAFTGEEVAAVRDWVAGGRSLFLIADHPPNVEAAAELGKVFGVRFRNGGAVDPRSPNGRIVFRRSDGTLLDHPVTQGVDVVATFTGSSFQLEAPGHPLLVFGPEVYSFREQDDPNPVKVRGHSQGALLPFGNGRVAVFAEAAMFSAQLTGPDKAPMGMNAPIARQNPQFLLNLVRWLVEVR